MGKIYIYILQGHFKFSDISHLTALCIQGERRFLRPVGARLLSEEFSKKEKFTSDGAYLHGYCQITGLQGLLAAPPSATVSCTYDNHQVFLVDKLSNLLIVGHIDQNEPARIYFTGKMRSGVVSPYSHQTNGIGL